VQRNVKKAIRKTVIAVPIVGAAFYFAPIPAAVFAACGFIDVMRNRRRDAMLFNRYFLGNGIPTWLLSPFNLIFDLLCYRNKGVYALDDLPPAWRAEVDEVLGVFRERREEIIADVDRAFGEGRRAMYVYRWYGRREAHGIAALDRDFRYIKTIAVSAFKGREATGFHFGPLRLTLRVLYNLRPTPSEDIFIECGGKKHYWHEDPLFIFDDTLMHRSVNLNEARRYCVFMDIVRPTPFPGLLSALVSAVSVAAARVNAVFYKHWKMLRPPPAAGRDPEPA
jgi:aspartyl/asparaginyl beta-hydroxylase (cupin superfamily)